MRKPRIVLQIPVDGFSFSVVNVSCGARARFPFDLRCVNGIVPIIPAAMLHMNTCSA